MITNFVIEGEKSIYVSDRMKTMAKGCRWEKQVRRIEAMSMIITLGMRRSRGFRRGTGHRTERFDGG